MKGVSQVQPEPGPVVILGSGETSSSGRRVFDRLLKGMPIFPRLALLETPAGFELNSDRVIGRVADFIQHRLQNYHPRLTIVPARRRGTDYSPDNPDVVAPLLEADLIFLGPGSPSYTVRQLQGSLAWQYLVARHRLGAALVLASAAAVAIGAFSLPVYEIYKVGEELHWNEGLNFFGLYGLPLVFIPHWNNKDGGIELDTSRCYMGQSRFTDLMELLPEDLTILGIDENTALVFDLKAGMGRVSGLGGVTLVHADYDQRSPISDLSVLEPVGASGHRKAYARRVGRNQTFLLSEYCPFKWPPTWHGVAPDVWEKALDAQARMDQQRRKLSQTGEVFQTEEEPAEIQALSTARNEARERRDWATADDLRREIEAMGWKLVDTPEGTKLMRNILVDESRSE